MEINTAVSGESYGGFGQVGTENQMPFSILALPSIEAKFNPFLDWDLTLKGVGALGYSNQTITSRESPNNTRFFYGDRIGAFLSRLTTFPQDQTAGIKELSFNLTKGEDADFALRLGIMPQENNTFFYNHNAVSFNLPGDSGETLTISLLRDAIFDTSSGADIYTLRIGPVLEGEVALPWGLRFYAQVATAGGAAEDTTAQALQASLDPEGQILGNATLRYNNEFGPVAVDAHIAYTHKSAAEDSNAFGEKVSATQGITGGVTATWNGLVLNVGMGQNWFAVTGDGLTVDTRQRALTASLGVPLGDTAWLTLAGAGLCFSEERKGFVKETESTCEIHPEVAAAWLVSPNFTFTASARGVMDDIEHGGTNQLQLTVGGAGSF